MNTPNEGKYTKVVQEIKQAETIILGNAELVLAHETLSQEGRERLEKIKKAVLRLDGLLEKINGGG